MKHITVTSTKSAKKQYGKQILAGIAFIALFLITSAFNNANATKSAYTDAVANFKASFKNVTEVNWKTTELYTKASFIQDGKHMEVFYSSNDGSLVATTKQIAFAALPARATKFISKHYPSEKYTVKSAIEYVNGEGEANYYVSLEDKKATTVVEVSKTGEVFFFKRIK